MKSVQLLIPILLLLSACARAPIKSVDQAMRKTSAPKVTDDLSFSNLEEAIKNNIAHLEAHPREMWFGDARVLSTDYIRALQELAEALRVDPTGALFYKTLDQNFEYREVYGDKEWGDVFITGYFEPMMRGSTRRTKTFTTPIYGAPENIVKINLAAFRDISPAWNQLVDHYKDKIMRDGMIRGRIENLPEVGPVVVPFFNRREIDSLRQLKKQKPLAWVDPIDAFFLQIQGSGTILLPKDKELRVGYLEQNGHPYVAIGRYLKDIIPLEEMSSHRIELHLRSLPVSEAQSLMEQNPSYVFFRELESAPVTAFGVEAVPGRSIATDAKYFPKGALAFLEFEKPVFEKESDIKPAQWVKAGRFVLDHDTGGAIRGPHRVDLFWGRGHEAKQASGVMRQSGRLYYLVPRNLSVHLN